MGEPTSNMEKIHGDRLLAAVPEPKIRVCDPQCKSIEHCDTWCCWLTVRTKCYKTEEECSRKCISYIF